MNAERINKIRIRIMQEAYDLADKDDSEGYNSVKVACSDVLTLIDELVEAEREACAQLCEQVTKQYNVHSNFMCASAIRARGEK